MGAEELKNNLDHARAAYLHAVRALPTYESIKSCSMRQNGFEFSSKNQIRSQIVELGWAFYCRYEACLEAWLKRNSVKLSKKNKIIDYLTGNNVNIPTDMAKGLEKYRKIRNSLHHDDGASFDGEDGYEIHLYPEHMDMFYNLFIWIAQQVERVNSITPPETPAPPS